MCWPESKIDWRSQADLRVRNPFGVFRIVRRNSFTANFFALVRLGSDNDVNELGEFFLSYKFELRLGIICSLPADFYKSVILYDLLVFRILIMTHSHPFTIIKNYYDVYEL